MHNDGSAGILGTVTLMLACFWALAIGGCGGSDSSNDSSEQFGQLPPGKVPHAAPSNAHKEIPTRFGRTVSLPYRSTVLYAKAIDAIDPIGTDASGNGAKRIVGIVVGLRNIGTSDWTGSVARLSQLAVSSGDKPDGLARSFGASAGPCPGPLIQTHAPVSSRALTLAAGRTAFECVRFRLAAGENPILFKFAAQASDYTLGAGSPGRYGVWALPGTLVEKCRFEPGTVKGRCHGLEVGEK
jgi:hypothetical protein